MGTNDVLWEAVPCVDSSVPEAIEVFCGAAVLFLDLAAVDVSRPWVWLYGEDLVVNCVFGKDFVGLNQVSSGSSESEGCELQSA